MKPGATLIRTLIDLWFVADSINTNALADMGIFMGTTEGIAAAAVPEPSTSGDNPGWIYRTRQFIPGTAADQAEAVHLEKDIRAMRKFGAQDRDVAMVIDAGSASAIDVTGLIRLLIKLP